TAAGSCAARRGRTAGRTPGSWTAERRGGGRWSTRMGTRRGVDATASRGATCARGVGRLERRTAPMADPTDEIERIRALLATNDGAVPFDVARTLLAALDAK